MNINTQIIEAMQKDKLILFVGAGLSISKGYPTWNELIEKILNKLEENDDTYKHFIPLLSGGKMDALQVLDIIKAKRKEVFEVLEDSIKIPIDDSNLKLHKKIGEISKKIITTNYDKLLETATGFSKITHSSEYNIASLSDRDNFVFKIHGCIDEPDHCILFQEDYINLYNETATVERLKGFISDYTILFIGFSYSDPFVKSLFEHINKVYKGLSTKHFILTTEELSIDGIENIILKNWGELDLFFDFLISKKDVNNSGISQLSISNNSQIIKVGKQIKIAVLISSPIDRESTISFEDISKKFNKYEILIENFPLSIDSLRNLDEFDYILCFCDFVKQKLIIEDTYLKSKRISLEEFSNNIANVDEIKGCFIFTNDNPNIDNIFMPFPLSIIWDEDITSIVFKIFQRKDLRLLNNSFFVNKENFEILPLPKGKMISKKPEDYAKIKSFENIELKNLMNFVGREIDLEDIIRKSLDTNHQILTIKGSGGIGKTTVVKMAAKKLFERGHYLDGVFFINCEFINNYQLFEHKVAQCFGIDNSINVQEHILDNNLHLESLIIFDNFEPLLYIDDTDKIKNLITFICDFVNIIITSREWVGFEFEERHELRSFTNQEAEALFYKYYKYKHNEEDKKILKEDILDKLLNNNPLAIKIITKNIPKNKDMTILKNELEEDFFNIVKDGYTDIFNEKIDENIERSKSLYQSIAYSYNKLLFKEKLLLEILYLFPSGIHMENIKNFFSQGDYRWDTHKITDVEIKSLENKSLIEISKGIIKLQSIIGRFSEYKFLERNNQEKVEYYKRAFNFNDFILDLINEISKKKGESVSLKIFDEQIENFLKVIDYLDKYEEENFEKLEYIIGIANSISDINHVSSFYPKILNLKDYFYKEKQLGLLFDCMVLVPIYYDGDFERSYNQILKIYSIEDLFSLNLNDNIEEYIFLAVAAIIKYKHQNNLREIIIKKNYLSFHLIKDFLFYSGEYEKLSYLNQKSNQEELDFFSIEIMYNKNELTKEKIEEIIDSFYEKEHLEILQTNYIKAKLGYIDKKTINSLVVTNPYTKGLKSLMFAFLEEDLDKAHLYYLDSMENLKHITYYYVEAIFYYAKFLKKHDFPEKTTWTEKGLLLAQANYYRVLIYRFERLADNSDELYNADNYIFPEVLSLDELIEDYLLRKSK